MNSPSAPNPDVFDVRKIRRLVELMKEHELSELDLQQGEVRVQLRRACGVVAAPVFAAPPVALPPSAAAAAPAAKVPEAAPAKTAENIAFIKSPMVGTFYAASDPEAAPFVKVGDHVGPDTTVCIVEAMKVFNQIPAEIAGRIIAVLVENGAPVEFGQPLFKIETGA